VDVDVGSPKKTWSRALAVADSLSALALQAMGVSISDVIVAFCRSTPFLCVIRVEMIGWIKSP
jgi:aryl-alcohol dehydrogenase-like predicted oxidoreductase